MEERKKKLEELRQKWAGRVPEPNDKNYWRFRVDRNHAYCLQKEIRRIALARDIPLNEVIKLFS